MRCVELRLETDEDSDNARRELAERLASIALAGGARTVAVRIVDGSLTAFAEAEDIDAVPVDPEGWPV